MTTYQRLGGYIRPVDVRNRGLKVHLSQGICNAKYFQNPKQVADNPETHKVVRTGQFAYNRATTRNGEKISIALREGPDCTVSSAYQVFEVVDENLLNPKYLMMWFKRPEFDRLAIYYSHGSAHEFFEWEAMCDVMLPIPSITRQREIVSEYETLTNRIRLNNQMIQHLEATAQALYRKTFVDNIDKENLPEGWRIGTIGEFCKEMKSGGTPSRSHNEYWDKKDYPWLKTGEVQNNVIINVEEYISEEGMKNSSAKIIPRGSVIMAMYGGGTVSNIAYLDCDTTTNQACCNMICNSKQDAAFLFFHLRYHQEDIKRLANGGAQENLSQEVIAQQPIIIFENNENKSLFIPIVR
jgi:restriction endonuclease S subunit